MRKTQVESPGACWGYFRLRSKRPLVCLGAKESRPALNRLMTMVCVEISDYFIYRIEDFEFLFFSEFNFLTSAIEVQVFCNSRERHQ